MACWRGFVFSLFLLAAGVAADNDLADFHFEGGGPGSDAMAEHFRLGSAMGSQYKLAIRNRMAVHSRTLNPFLASEAGRKVYDQLLHNHQRLVPQLVKEIEGIASGSGVAFETVFAASLEEELSYFMPEQKRGADHCSDYMFCTAERCLNGHNEDGDLVDEHMFAAYVRFGDANFTAVNYAGDLLGGMSSVAFNAHGLAFSLNWVGPATVELDGLGRNFVSRLLLEAKTWEEAVATISRKHAAGHNYQLMDFANRRIANIEVAHDQVAVRAIETPYFHANKYQTLSVPGQEINNSTIHRLARVQQLPLPATAEDVLRILGDQVDREYPIYHDIRSHEAGDLADWTLATALFDLDAKVIHLMGGNPADLRVRRVFHLSSGTAPAPNVMLM